MSTHEQYGSAASDGYRIEDAMAILDADQIAEAVPFGEIKPIVPGQIMFAAGDATTTFVLLLEGEIELYRGNGEGETVVLGLHEPGSFLGELNLLTGQRRFLTSRARTAGRVLVVEAADFHRMMSTRTSLADTIFRILSARREFLRQGEGARAIEIIGSPFSREAMALRGFATRSHIAYTWIDVEQVDDVEELLRSKGAVS